MTPPAAQHLPNAAVEGVPAPRPAEAGVPEPAPSSDAPRSPSPSPARRSPGAAIFHICRTYSLLVLLIASFVLYGTWSKTSGPFLSVDNFRNIAAGQAVLAVLTLGILIPMVSGHIDLSVGNIAGLSSITTASMYADHHANLLVGILVGIGVGTAVGAITGLLVTTLRVDPFIITLGTASVILGYIQWFTNGQSIINGIPRSLIDFGGTNLFGVPKIVFVMLVTAALVYYVLEHTPYGRNLHAIGSNKAAARLVGIRVERTVLSAFALTGAFAGVAGVLLLANSGSGNPQVGQTFTLTAIAAAFLGAASFKVGRLNVPGTLVAIFFLAVNITGLTFAGVQNWINQVFTGLSLVLAIALAAVLSKERKAKKVSA
ncbi:MAG: ribose ABC transporter permease [Mycobacteriales bacterium]